MKMVLTGLGKIEARPEDLTGRPAGEDCKSTRVLCCAICRTDAKMWEQGHRDLVLPRVMGHEMVVVDESGRQYVVWPGKSCGTCRYCLAGRENLCEDMKITGFHSDGGFSSQAHLPAKSLIPMPETMDIHAACFAEPVACVVNAFEKLDIEGKEKVLVYGAGTMGLIAALFAHHLGLTPIILEKNESKIAHVSRFLEATGFTCSKDTHTSEFEIAINACADYIAFCQILAKIAKGGQISFFSGLSKNEHIETNLLNLIHYKEASVSGVYGMTKAHMQKGLPFIRAYEKELLMLIEAVETPDRLPDLMPNVLSGDKLKYIIDFRQTEKHSQTQPAGRNAASLKKPPAATQAVTGLCRQIIDAVSALPDTLSAAATAKMDDKTKPLGALGRLEPLGIKIACIQDSLTPKIRQKNLFVFAGDHGITEEGVSAYPSEVTAQMAENFLNGGAAINVLCRHFHIEMKIVDMGIKKDLAPHPDLLIKKVASGTRNFALEDAMSQKQMHLALENGMRVFLEAYERRPIDSVGLGEMGIGNTTSAAAIISCVTGISPQQAAGRGTGVDDRGLKHKTEVIERVLNFHQIDPGNGFQILQKIGGFEIAGIAGAVLAAASKKCAVVLDGVISTAAGLAAYLISPAIKDYLICGHKSVEASQAAALSFMGLDPVIDLEMRLGEGTGAAIAMNMAEAACKIMCEMASFDEAKVARSSLSGQIR